VDATEYASWDAKREPFQWVAEQGRLRIVVVRRFGKYASWMFACPALFGAPRPLTCHDADGAKAEALAIVQRRLDELTRDLAAIVAANNPAMCSPKVVAATQDDARAEGFAEAKARCAAMVESMLDLCDYGGDVLLEASDVLGEKADALSGEVAPSDRIEHPLQACARAIRALKPEASSCE
jgi:hypothetical protein